MSKPDYDFIGSAIHWVAYCTNIAPGSAKALDALWVRAKKLEKVAEAAKNLRIWHMDPCALSSSYPIGRCLCGVDELRKALKELEDE